MNQPFCDENNQIHIGKIFNKIMYIHKRIYYMRNHNERKLKNEVNK